MKTDIPWRLRPWSYERAVHAVALCIASDDLYTTNVMESMALYLRDVGEDARPFVAERIADLATA